MKKFLIITGLILILTPSLITNAENTNLPNAPNQIMPSNYHALLDKIYNDYVNLSSISTNSVSSNVQTDNTNQNWDTLYTNAMAVNSNFKPYYLRLESDLSNGNKKIYLILYWAETDRYFEPLTYINNNDGLEHSFIAFQSISNIYFGGLLDDKPYDYFVSNSLIWTINNEWVHYGYDMGAISNIVGDIKGVNYDYQLDDISDITLFDLTSPTAVDDPNSTPSKYETCSSIDLFCHFRNGLRWGFIPQIPFEERKDAVFNQLTEKYSEIFQARETMINSLTQLLDVIMNGPTNRTWSGVNADLSNYGNFSLGTVQIISPDTINEYGPKIKTWISIVIYLMIFIFLIKRISNILAAGKGGD